MPLKRTPTSSPTLKKPSSSVETEKGSEDYRNVNCRTRSSKTSHNDGLSNGMADIIKMIADLKAEQNERLDALQDTIDGIRKQNDGIVQSVEHLSNEYRELKNKLENMEKERKDNLRYIQVLENKIDYLEKSQKCTSVEIRNIPPNQKETKLDLLNVVNKIGTAINLPIPTDGIRDLYRINTKTEDNKPIIVDFTSVITKERVLEHSKKFNNQHKNNKLNSTHLHISGPSRNVYISEHLTPKARRLFFLARDFTNSYNYKYCWTAGGNVFIRRKEGGAFSSRWWKMQTKNINLSQEQRNKDNSETQKMGRQDPQGLSIEGSVDDQVTYLNQVTAPAIGSTYFGAEGHHSISYESQGRNLLNIS
ncbi:hypothetical protein B5X24_HaOG204612 [Helicoverpa armigera]|nr:hypothetical protein B5X24_HaOG204612 [Helicoverpa armigera]